MSDSGKSVKLQAFAKINTVLDVVGKRPDGYHDIASIMQTVSLCDTLTFEKVATEEGVTLTCDRGDLSVGEDNLILKAARRMKELYPDKLIGGLKIDLEKRIPMQAGLGGGSADAAATLHALNTIFEIGASNEELAQIGAKLGADVPFCVYGGLALCEGIGEVITPIKSSCPQAVIIVKPNISVSTPWAYGRIDATPKLKHPNALKAVEAVSEGDFDKYLSSLGNVFEEAIISDYPQIAEIKRILCESGCFFAQMSGSGPSVFGFAGDDFDLSTIARKVSERLPEYEVFTAITM